jgi:hypothetical protein
MPIYPLLSGAGFDSDLTQAMGIAFEDTLRELGLTDRTDPLAILIARKIIELGQRGERDPERLRRLTISDLTA